ncbi:hypothetical protein JHK86_019859 [Glycine max]|nr:hypothetical protein JHK86_019859 [Glycine max]
MEQLVNFIIRPPRAEYDPKSDLLDQEFMLKGKWYQRKDVEIKNSRGDVLQCSHYLPIVSPEGKPLPCVIYCHGNSLMYGAEDPSIAGMVLDSPFSDLVDLMMELVDTYKVRLPKFTVKFAIQYMRRAIQKKAKFDIMDLNTIKVAKSCFVPALLGHAIDDDFIQPHHSDRIFEAYMGDKNIIKFDGDHNSPRPQFYFDSINIFFHNVLQPPEDEVGESFFDPVNDYFDAEPSTSSTINAIEQVRSRRPMSRMEVPSAISSKDEHCEHEEKCGNISPSSSSMISFELSNDDPFGSHVPATLEDDQYVEYQLDDLAGFPSTAEEEERMFMEAVMESLKDLEVRNPNADQPTSSFSSLSVAAVEPSDKGASWQEISRPVETESSSLKHTTDSKSKTTSSTAEECEPLKGESNSISVNHSQNVVSEPSPVPSVSLEGPAHLQLQPPPSAPTDTLSVTESSNTSGSARSDSSASLQSSSETDVSHNTKATVTVVRNPAGHVMDGLMRRWDFNFFKNK